MAQRTMFGIFKSLKNNIPRKWTKFGMNLFKRENNIQRSNVISTTHAITSSTAVAAFVFWTTVFNHKQNIFAISFGKSKENKGKLEEYLDPNAEFLVKTDLLYDQMKFEDLYNLLDSKKEENNDEILWRLARVLFRLSKSTEENTKKIDYLTRAKDYVYKALDISATNFASHKWASIIIIELAEFQGTKAKLQQSYVSKEHMLKAHELNPKDGTTLYLLGVWCFTFADLSWTQRKLAGVLFATPPSSSYYEAYTFFTKAEEVEPGFYSMNLLMLGKTNMKMGDNARAIEFLKRARDYPQKTEDDKDAHREAIELLKQLGQV